MRAVVNSLLIALITVVLALTACVAWIFDRTGDAVIECARMWGRLLCRATGVRVAIKGVEKIRPDRTYVFMANHLSAADIWALYAVLPVPVRMIAKAQLGRIPFLGWAMHAGRFIFINRQNAVEARRSLDRAADRIREGCSVLLFPEGTRSRDGHLKHFKKGGFHLALRAGVSIVPVAVQGTWELAPPDSFWVRPGNVTVTLGEPVETAGLPDAELSALVVRVRAEIAGVLGEAADDPGSPPHGSSSDGTPAVRAAQS